MCFVSSIQPTNLLTGQSVEMTLLGSGFSGTVRVIIYGYFIPVRFRTSTMLQFTLPSLPEGTYDITVLNGDGAQWVCRQALVITTPEGQYPEVGSPQLPLVLPPIVVDAVCGSEINPATQYRDTDSAALVTYDPQTGLVSANMKPDSSAVDQESVSRTATQDNPSAGQTLVTPWGTFTNG